MSLTWTPLLPLCLVAVSCAGTQIGRNLPHGPLAYSIIPVVNPDRAKEDYRIGPLDALDVTVFQEPELSVKAVKVDAFGDVAAPLVGSGSIAIDRADKACRRLRVAVRTMRCRR